MALSGSDRHQAGEVSEERVLHKASVRPRSGRGMAGLATFITRMETPGAFETGDREQLLQPSYGETRFLYLVFFVMFLVHCNAM